MKNEIMSNIIWPLAVIAVIGILAAIAIPKLGGHTYSKDSAAAGDISAWNSALLFYRNDVADTQFPKTTLLQLFSDNASGWAGPYVPTICNDPWNNEYTYTSDGTTYTIQSIHKSDYNKSETIRYCFGTGVMESLP